MLNLVVREIVERAQNDRLEHHNRIPRLASRPRFTRLVRTPPHRLKTRAQVFPRNHPVDLQKRLVLGVKTGIPVPKIEKPHLTHQPRLPLSTNRQPDSKSTTPEKGEFLEVPFGQTSVHVLAQKTELASINPGLEFQPLSGVTGHAHCANRRRSGGDYEAPHSPAPLIALPPAAQEGRSPRAVPAGRHRACTR